MDTFACLDSHPNLLGLFDTTIAPTLLYYSYIPIVFISLAFALFIFFKNRSLLSRSLVTIAVLFSLWIANELIQWIAVESWMVHFGWEISGLLQIGLITSILYFVYVFLNEKSPSFRSKVAYFFLLLPVLMTLPTRFNMTSFDLIECQSLFASTLWYYIYLLEILAIFTTAYLCVKKYRQSETKIQKKQTVYLGVSTIFFLGLFVLTNIAGDATLVYEFNLIGPLGMALFIASLSYMIVQFKIFNIKLIATQALVFGLWVLVFAILFIRNIQNVRYVVIATLVLLFFIGYQLIKSVKNEILQRELIEKQKTALENANTRLQELDKQKTEFLSFASHQIKNPLTAIKGYSSMAAEGDYGEVGEELKGVFKTIFESAQSLIDVVQDFLDVSKIEQGGMKYDMQPFDLKEMIQAITNQLKPNAMAKGLEFDISLPAEPVQIIGDHTKLRQVFLNLIDNSIKYTQSGTVAVSFEVGNPSVIFKVKDTGIGIPQDEIPKLFNKFTRATGANKVNVMGTGLGLYLAKQIVEAHKGRIMIQSDGVGKGSTFAVELPV